MPRFVSLRLLLSACVAGLVTASICATAQVVADPKKNPSEEAFVFDRIYNLIRYEDDGTEAVIPFPRRLRRTDRLVQRPRAI